MANLVVKPLREYKNISINHHDIRNMEQLENSVCTALNALITTINIMYLDSITRNLSGADPYKDFVLCGITAYNKFVNDINYPNNIPQLEVHVTKAMYKKYTINTFYNFYEQLKTHDTEKILFFFIRNILLRLGLVTDKTPDISNQYKIIKGVYDKGGNMKECVFIGMRLRDDMFHNNFFMNGNVNDPKFNVIFVPLLIVHDDPNYYKYKPAKSKEFFYSSLPQVVYELLKYDVDATKVELFKNILKQDSPICLFSSGYTCPRLTETLYNIFDVDKDTLQIIDKVVNIYGSNFDDHICANSSCTTFPELFQNNLIFSDNSNNNVQVYTNILKTFDSNFKQALYYYTENYSRDMNIYLQLRNLGLNVPNNDRKSKETNEHISNAIKLFATIKLDKYYIDVKNNLFNDHFTVYSINRFVCFFDDEYKLALDEKSLTQLKSSIIYMPSFLSTSYNINAINRFYKSYKVVYAITVPRKSEKWIWVEKISAFVHEKEILLDAGCYFTIHDVKYLSRDGSDERVKVVYMQLHDTIEEAINHVSNASTINIVNEPYKNIQTGGNLWRKINRSNTILMNYNDFSHSSEYSNENFFNTYFDLFHKLIKLSKEPNSVGSIENFKTQQLVFV